MGARAMVLTLVAFVSGCAARITGGAQPALAPAAEIAGDRAQASRDSNSPAESSFDKVTVEAEVNLQVESVEDAAQAVRVVVKELGGKISNDEILREANIASFVLRLPPDRIDTFMTRLATVGIITHRRVRLADVTKQYVDTKIQLDNLLQALTRYQEILKAATKVDEMLAVEQQLTRVRSDIERLKGELAYVADRVELATVIVSISPVEEGPAFSPEAKFHPGVSAVYLAALRQGHRPRGYVGPGFNLYFARAIHFDVAVLRVTETGPFSADAIIMSMGGEAYSDFLGRGKRVFLNPFFGYNLGWTRLERVDFVSAGLTAGVELVKIDYLLIDLAVRGEALTNRSALRMAVQPQLSANVAF